MQIALLGEISAHVRLVAASLNDEGEALLRFYFDRTPIENDIEQVSIVGTNFGAMVTREQVRTMQEECVYATDRVGQLDTLGGVLFCRME